MSVNSLGSYQYQPSMNLSAYYDYDDLDMGYGTYPPIGMGGSIFNPMPMVGMGGFNNQVYFDNMKDYQKFYASYGIDQQNMQRNAELKINAPMESIKGSAALLKDKILNNEQGQIQEAFAKYLNSVRLAYGEGTDAEVKARALSLYAQMNGGKSLYQDLRENAHGSFLQGVIHGSSFGTYGNKSAEDNISEISGLTVGTEEKASQNLGRITGAAMVGTGAGFVTSKLFGKVATETGKAASNSIIGKGGKVGLIVGLGALIASFITGKVTT